MGSDSVQTPESNTLLERFAAALDTPAGTVADVQDFVEWHTQRRGVAFVPDSNDDVELRTYLWHLHTLGRPREAIRRKMNALEQFYGWVTETYALKSNPFVSFKFDRPILTREEIRRRRETFSTHPQEREIARLRALNHLAAHINRSHDVQTLLDGALETLTNVMHLKTAWGFLWHRNAAREGDAHDFVLAAECQLPAGLERNNRIYLRKPPDCHCQLVMRNGRLTRAVNIVECTRLMDSAETRGDNRGLLFHASVPLLSQGEPLGIVNFATEEWQLLTAADLELLSAAGAQIAVGLERARLYEETQHQRARLERELAMARMVQASLLPSPLPLLGDFQVAAEWRAAREVGGDFYDVFPIAGERWGLVVADVADKGAPAALYMAMVRSLIRAKAEQDPSPSRVLTEVNRSLSSQSSSDMFVTVFYALIDPALRTLTYANAGHNPPVVRRGSDLIELTRTGPALGVFEKIRLNQASFILAADDAFIAYTDGLSDAHNMQGALYGEERFDRAVLTAPASAPAMLEYLLTDWSEFVGSQTQQDDVTLLVLTDAAA